jgi:hypothetical protein
MTRSAPFFRGITRAMNACVLAVSLVCLVVSARVPLQAQRARQRLRVLLIGNSYTFYNNLGDIVAGISRSKKDGPIIDATIAAAQNRDLAWHLENGPAMPALEKGGWDFVSIQETSLLPGGSMVGGKPVVGDPAKPGGFYDSAREMVKRIRAKGATPILEMTWARRDNPGTMQQDLAAAFGTIGKELDVRVAPIGLAWQEARWRLRTLEFHFRDGAHPSEAGSYLTAAVIYATITGHDPRGAAAVIMGHPVKDDGVVDMGKTVPLVDLGQPTAAELQKIAWETVTAAAKSAPSASLPAIAPASAWASAGRE